MKPEISKIPEFYQPYILKLPEGNLVDLLKSLGEKLSDQLRLISESDAMIAYAPGKWSIKELIGHINDAERIFTYRALCIARGETISLPGFDENLYVENSEANDRTFESLINEFKNIRQATIDLYGSLSTVQLNRIGKANNLNFTPEIIGYITAGHQNHHYQILTERYLPVLNK